MKAIAAGDWFGLAITEGGPHEVVSWGLNDLGQLGEGGRGGEFCHGLPCWPVPGRVLEWVDGEEKPLIGVEAITAESGGMALAEDTALEWGPRPGAPEKCEIASETYKPCRRWAEPLRSLGEPIQGISAGEELGLAFGAAGPIVESVSPAHGKVGDKVKITGRNLGKTAEEITAIYFGPYKATGWTVAKENTEIEVTAPSWEEKSEASGRVNITVTTREGLVDTSPEDTGSAFLYENEQAPEFGRCFKDTAKGDFTDGGCTTEGKGGNYEWCEGASVKGENPACPAGALKRGFTLTGVLHEEKEKEKETIIIETKGLTNIECHGATGSGEYADATKDAKELQNIGLRLTGCKEVYSTCMSAGASEGGEIETAGLVGVLRDNEKTHNAELVLEPESEGVFAEFECGASPIKLTGSLRVSLSTAQNKMKEEATLKFEGKGTLERHTGSETVESARLLGTLKLKDEESIEIDADV